MAHLWHAFSRDSSNPTTVFLTSHRAPMDTQEKLEARASEETRVPR